MSIKDIGESGQTHEKMRLPFNDLGSLQPGIVLIDEVETHLHLELQRLVMPILTSLFPKIQFIVTTHSPFVLSSIGNAVAFDLEKHEALDNADEYPYESLIGGYFGVQDTPAAITGKLRRVRELIRTGNNLAAKLSLLRDCPALLEDFRQETIWNRS